MKNDIQQTLIAIFALGSFAFIVVGILTMLYMIVFG